MRTPFLIIPLLAAMSITAQQRVTPSVKEANTAAQLAEKLESRLLAPEPPPQTQPETPAPSQSDPATAQQASSRVSLNAPTTWKKFTGSMNIFGMTVSEARPLQYNDELRTVSFVHRKPTDYAPRPMPSDNNAKSGAIVGMFSTNWGSEWDTTLLWNSESYFGRYPQGGIYNSVNNECIYVDAQFVATGPLTNAAGGWHGSFLASKDLDSLRGSGNTDTVSVDLADHFFLGSNPVDPIGKIDFPSHDFCVTDDGIVRSLGYLTTDVNGTGSAFGLKGASIVKGTFAAGDFTWEIDSFMPKFYTSPGGTLHIVLTPHMAWNESGTVGYVWFIGVREPRPGQGDTLANMGFQPIIFKTTNSGNSWTEMPRINFNDTSGAYNAVFRQMFAVRNDSLGIPFFNFTEGIDGIVDRNDRLHIVSTVVGTARKHPDSLGFTFLFNHADGEVYRFRHTTGLHPYIFDFTETNQATWRVTVIDSMSSEAPGKTIGSDGYSDNPWDLGGTTGTDKVDTEARIQLSRSPDGRYIIYTWAESDTAYTTSNHKWNAKPNIKARMAEIGPESSSSSPAGFTLHPTEINITSPSLLTLPPYTKTLQVSDRATCHFISPKCAVISHSMSSGVAIGLPITVSNNSFTPLKQASSVDHWYLSANLNFDNVSSINWPAYKCTGVSVEQKAMAVSSVVYPNPGDGAGQLSVYLRQAQQVRMEVRNSMGQPVHVEVFRGKAGENLLSFDVRHLPAGSYIVSIQGGGTVNTQKLLIMH